jgi:hypothetical protein
MEGKKERTELLVTICFHTEWIFILKETKLKTANSSNLFNILEEREKKTTPQTQPKINR